MPSNKRKYIFIGLLAIVMVYSLYYLCLVYVSYYDAIPRKVRHFSRFATIALVYAAGFYSLKKYGVKWITQVWSIIYFMTLALLIFIGLYDWSLGPASMQLRNIAKTLHEFLISPILFVALLIINRTLNKLAVNG